MMKFYVNYGCICKTVTKVVECKNREIAEEYTYYFSSAR